MNLLIRLFSIVRGLLLSAIVLSLLYSYPSHASGQSWWYLGGHAGNNQQCVSDHAGVETREWQPGQNQFSLQGDAIETGSSLQLTDGLRQASAVFWRQPLSLYQPDVRERSFSSAFSFRISNSTGISDGDGQGGDGLTFVLNASDQELGLQGGGLGYAGMHNSIAVEFDTWNNGKSDKNSGNHIGINLGGQTKSRRLHKVDGRLNDGEQWYVWIDYQGERQKLEVRLAKAPVRPVDSLLSRKVRIPWWVGGSKGFVGFTAGTGDAGNRHEILGFQFTNAYAPVGECDPPEFVSAPVESAFVDTLYSYVALANDATPGDSLTYLLLEAPAGMVIDPALGQLSWQPLEHQVGEHNVVIEVVDTIGLRDQQSFSVTVEAASCAVENLRRVSYPHFEDVSNWQLNGSSSELTPNKYNVLRLTRDLSQSGSAFLKDAIDLGGGQPGSSSFSASFGFRLTHPTGISDQDGQGADGLVFIVQSMDSTVGGRGGGIGYDGIGHSLGIEFDTWNNGAVDGNNGNHVGINLNGNMASISRQPVSERFNDGDQWYAWVNYNGDSQTLELRLARQKLRPDEPVMVQQGIDLTAVLQSDQAFFGFTSGTGAGGGHHDVFEFEFNSDDGHSGECGSLAFLSTPPADVISGQQLVYVTEVVGVDATAQLGYSIVAGPPGATIDADGILTWNAAAPGTVDFTLRVEAAGRGSAQQSFSIDVLPVPNQPPQANNLNISTFEDAPITVVLDASDVDGDPLAFTLIDLPVNGMLSGNAPNLVYLPNAHFSGIDSFTYRVNDGELDSSAASVSIAVAAVNDAPFAENQNGTIAEDDSLSGQLLASDVEGSALSFRLVQAADSGVVVVQADGAFVYTPNPDFNGTDGFSFVANDGNLDSNPASVNLTVDPVNDAPVALAGSVDVFEDNVAAILLKATDVDGDALSYRVVVPSVNGLLTGAGAGRSYTPTTNFAGTDQFTFVASDGIGDSNTAIVSIEVAAINDHPVIVSEPLNTAIEGQQYSYQVDVTDADGDQPVYSLTTGPAGMILNSDGLLSWTPLRVDAGTNAVVVTVSDGNGGSDTQSFGLLVEAAPNSEPAFSSTPPLSGRVGTSYQYLLVATDADADDLDFTLESGPAGMMLTGALLEWQPDEMQQGTHPVIISVSDSVNSAVLQSFSILVDEANVAPLILSAAQTEAVEGQGYEYDVDASDANPGDVLQYSLLIAPATMQIDADTGLITWTPGLNDGSGVLSANTRCAVSQDDVVTLDPAVDLIVVMDESGSMLTEQIWSQAFIAPLNAALLSRGVGVGDEVNRYGLVGFGAQDPQPRSLLINRKLLDEYQHYDAAAEEFLVSGQFEDGWAGIKFAFDQYPLRENSSKNIILVTDEDRDDISGRGFPQYKLSYADVIDSLISNDALLNVVIRVNFVCGDGTEAFGLDSKGNGYFHKGSGNYGLCTGVTINSTDKPPFGTSVADYADLAWDTGGAVWSLRDLRGGGEVAEALSKALKDIKVREIVTSIPAIKQADLALSWMRYQQADGSLRVDVSNRGLIESLPATLNLYFDLEASTNLLGSESIGVGAPGASTTLVFDASVVAGNASAFIARLDGDTDAECTIANNRLEANLVQLRVTDAAGLFDEQAYVIDVAEVNEAPQIVSTPVTRVSVGEIYRYQVLATDPDSGDAVSFSLIQGPPGMSIDELTGEIDFKSLAELQGTYEVTVQVYDLAGLGDSQTFQLEIDTLYLPPTIVSDPVYYGVVETLYRYQPTVSADPASVLYFDLLHTVEALQIDHDTGLIEWLVPLDRMNNYVNVAFKVEDQFGNVDTQQFRLHVDQPNVGPTILSTPPTRHANFGAGLYFYDPVVDDPNYYEELSWTVRSGLTGMRIDLFPLTFIGNRYLGPFDRLQWPDDDFAELIHEAQSNTHYQCRIESGLQSTSARIDWSVDMNRRQFAQPLIAPLADTNANSQLDGGDDSFIFIASRQLDRQSATPALHVLDLRGNLVWEWDVNQLDWYAVPAVADLDGDLKAEILVKTMNGEIVALDNLGEEKWRSAVVAHAGSTARYGTITLADLDYDGNTEILFGGSVLDHQGNLLWRITDADIGNTVADAVALAVDLDDDGQMEVLFNHSVYDHLGNPLWQMLDGDGSASYRRVYFALLNADVDENPEVVVSSHSLGNDYFLSLFDNDGSLLWQKQAESAGPLNVVDVNRDGMPEIINPAELAAYDVAGNELWRRTDLVDRSARGAAAADLNRDGSIEVILYASPGFRILDARSGSDLSTPRLDQSFSLSQPLVYTNKDDEAAILFGGNTAIYSLTADTGPWPGSAGNRINNQFFYAEIAQEKNELGFIAASSKPWFTRNSFQYQGDVTNGLGAGYQADLMPLNANLTYDDGSGSNTLSVDVLNRGLARADADFELVVRLNSPLGIEVARATIPGLEANATASRLFTNLGDGVLGQVLHISVEYSAGIDECVIANNAISIGAIGLVVEDKEGLSDRQVFSLTVYDENQGARYIYLPLPDATEGEEYRFTFQGEDDDIGDFVIYKPLSTLPEGATLNETTGEFIWTPPFGSAGTQNVGVRFEDLRGAGDTRVFPLVVNPSTQPNTAPVLDAIDDQQVKPGETLQLNANATDAENHPVFYTLLQNPSGMTIDRDSGLIDWTPNSAQVGEHLVSLSATDIRNAEDNFSFSVTVVANSAPEIAGTAPARAIVGVNYTYNLLASDADGDALGYQLISGPLGMSVDSSGQISWLPDATHLPRQQAVIIVTDGQITLTLTLTIPVVEPNTAPIITSTPVTSVTAGDTYQYAVKALDNENDTLVYQFNMAPSGMTIDSASGVVTWSPGAPDLGRHSVEISIGDSRGGFAQQNYTLVVNDGVSNLPPQITSVAPQFVVEGQLFSYTVAAIDPDDDSLVTSLVQAPGGSTLNGDTIEWTPASGGEVPRYASFRVEVSDGSNTAYQNFVVAVVDSDFDPLALIATLILTRTEYDLGELLQIRVAASGPGPIDRSLTVNGDPVEITDIGEAYYRLDQPGSYRILFSASNGEQTDSTEEFVSVIDPGDITFPRVEIKSPTQQQTITSRIDIIGTAEDANLRYYQLSYQRADAKIATFLPRQTASVVDGVLGSFDASLMLNGVYYIALTAVDINGHQSQESIAVIVDGQIKVGNFSVTLEDLDIPVTGIPVRITRSYDTRRKHERLDFGYGWSIDYQNVQVTETRTPGVAWRLNEYRSGFQNSTINFCVQPLGQPQVVVQLPDGDIETFDVRAEPECQLYIPRIDVQMAFEPTDGTTSMLELRNDPVLRLANGNLVELGENVDQGFDPSLYQLTTKSGMTYLLDQDFGITQVIDINGNTLTYSDAGIVHSSGKSIDFIRDTQGRITRILDPMGQEIRYEYTNGGDLDASTDREGNTTTYDYDAAHGLTDLIDPLGRPIIKNFYDANGRLEAQQDADGNRTEFVHDLTGRTSQVTDRLGRITQFAYDLRGNVTSEVDALGHLTTYTYDAHDNQTSRTDAFGNVAMATWDDQRNQLSQVDELGSTTSFTYNQWGKELTITDPRGRSYRNTYDAVGNLRSISDPRSFTAGVVQLNVKGLVTRVFDTYSNITEYTYDTDGNKLTETDALGNIISFTYDDNGNVLTETVQRTVDGQLVDEITRFEYDSQDRVIRTTDGLGNVMQMVYDEVGNKVKGIDALGRATVYTYDVYRRLTRTDYPDGNFTTMSYDAEGNLLTETDTNGYRTSYEYDALNRQIRTTYADGSSTQTAYDALGRVTSEIDERGNVTSFDYDATGQRIKTTNALGEATSFSYDDNGNLSTMTDARGNTWRYAYDVYDNRTVTTWPDGSTSSEITDRLGRITEKTDQTGNTMRFDYDALGRLLEVTDALNQLTTYTYDEIGNKLTQTDAKGRTTFWTYDALGREQTRTLPLGQQESHQYDAVGNRKQMTDFNGQVTTWAYDAMDRMGSATYQDSSIETFGYDDYGNRISATDRSRHVQSWKFDSRYRLTQVIDAVGNRIGYQYDKTGNKTQQTTTPAGEAAMVTTYSYDLLNRLESVTDAKAQVTTYAYDANGNRASVAYPNGNVTTYVYDVNNRLIRQTTINGLNALIADYQYKLDPSGHRLQIDEPGRSTSYTYDDSYKLLTENIVDLVNGDHNAAYEYDAVGNRIYGTINGVQTQYIYDDNDQLLQQGGEVLTYDANGNTLTKTAGGFQSTYSYDAKNHLASAQLNEGGVVTATSYRYDVDAIRIQKTEGGDTIDYLIDPNRDYAQVLRETGSAGSSIDYLYGDDLIQQSQSAVNERYYLYDGLGSTRLLTDSAGVITDSYNYEAFGSVIYQTGITENNYRFTGEQYDDGLGQYYLRARYYDPKSARFTQMDAWVGEEADPLSLHKYLYTGSDPINHVDPSGHFFSLGEASAATNIASSLSAATIAFYAMGQSLSVGWDAKNGPSNVQAGWLVLSAAMNLNSTLSKFIAAKARARGKGKAAVIGESMPRVMAYANAIGAEYWKIPGDFVSFEANKKWINRVMDRELAIMDIGPSPHTDIFPLPSSDYYKLELREIANRKYSKYYKLF